MFLDKKKNYIPFVYEYNSAISALQATIILLKS